MYLVAILINALIGGTLARMYGAGGYIPRIPMALLCMVPFAAVCGIQTFSPYAALAFLGAFGVTTGHGQYFSVQEKHISPEKIDFIVRVLFDFPVNTAQFFLRGCTEPHLILDSDPRTKGRLISYYGIQKLRWRNAFGMLITGSMVGLPASLICAYFNEPKAAILLSLTGVVKAGAYYFSLDTEQAEWMNGFFRTLLCGLADDWCIVD